MDLARGALILIEKNYLGANNRRLLAILDRAANGSGDLLSVEPRYTQQRRRQNGSARYASKLHTITPIRRFCTQSEPKRPPYPATLIALRDNTIRFASECQ